VLRVRLVQMKVAPGRPRDNTETMLQAVSRARSDRVDVLVFPEMAVPGYLIGDAWEWDTFLRECEDCTRELSHASHDLVTVFGNVAADHDRRNEDGRTRKYNALFVADNGRLVGPDAGPYPFVIKTLLPNYREFDDSRHFFDLRKLAIERNCGLADLVSPVTTSRGRLGCVLCEDGWDMDYNVSPLRMLAAHRPDLYINISASPYTSSKNHKRHRVFSEQAVELGSPLAYVNHVGIQNNGKTVFTFDGSSCIYDGHGHASPCGSLFEEQELTHDIPLGGQAVFGETVKPRRDGIPEICRALLYGTRQFLELCPAERVVIGVSGGIDSAVVAALYRRILPPENILLVNMPSCYNSPTTISLADRLARNLDCLYTTVPIDDSVALSVGQMDGLTVSATDGRASQTLSLSSLDRENVQARDRSSRILAALASAFGGVFTCNANKSEATVGYATLYGDLGGYLANLADLWKTEVYELAAHLNSAVYEEQVIPDDILKLTPSAELSPDQDVDQGKGDPLVYAYHDCLFASWVESWNRTTPEDALRWYLEGSLEENIGYTGDLRTLFPSPHDFVNDLERWWNLYQGMGLAKRIQAPPVLAVKRRAFGFDMRESQMGAVYTQTYRDLKRQVTG
jgi:NAD+ synthase (glutamine-hydrolysing)